MKVKKQLYIIVLIISAFCLSACGSRNSNSEKKEDSKVKNSASEIELDYKSGDINKVSMYFLGEEIYTEDKETISLIYNEVFKSDIKTEKLESYENTKEGSYDFQFFYNEDVVIDVVCPEDNIIGINSTWYKTDNNNDWNNICEQLIKGASNVDLLSESDIEGVDKLVIGADDKTEEFTEKEEIKEILNSLFMSKPAYTTKHNTEYYSGKIHDLKAYSQNKLVYTIKVYSENNGNMISVNDTMYHYFGTPDFSRLP